MEDQEKILQIIPAAGWYAKYTDDTAADPLDPVVCFALVEISRDGEIWREVRPLGPDGKRIELVDTASNFSTLIYRPNYSGYDA